MAIESHPIPKVAQTAIQLARQSFQALAGQIGREACEAIGLNPDDNWNVNFDAGQITREVAETEPVAHS